MLGGFCAYLFFRERVDAASFCFVPVLNMSGFMERRPVWSTQTLDF